MTWLTILSAIWFAFGSALPDQPRRLVSLAPNLTEILFALELGERLVGVTDFCDYPPAAGDIPKVGGYIDPNLEIIAAMKPDLVLALPEHQASVARLEALGLKVATVKNWSLPDIHDSIETLGRLTGHLERAQELITALRQRQTQLQRHREPPIRCLLVLGHEVTGNAVKEVFIVGRNGYLNEVLELAGGMNVFEKSQPHFPKVSREGLIQLDPDVIVELVPYPDTQGGDDRKRMAAWQAMPFLRAAKQGKIHILRGDYLFRAGPRYLQVLEELTAILDRQ